MNKKIILPNGSRIVFEKIKQLDTVSVGFWFSTGSAAEKKEENGYTHFIEHMLFKGTKNTSAKELIKQIECVGGIFNAFTSRHFTSFYINIMSKYFNRSIDSLIDIISNSLFDEKEMEREKGVIIEEINMVNDSPEEIAGNMFFKNAYKNSGMALPIAGSVSNIKKIKREKILEFYDEKFNSNNLIISIAGNFDIDYLEKKLNSIKLKNNQATKWEDNALFNYKTTSIEKADLNQVYFSLICPSFKFGDIRNYSVHAISDIFGGTSYSRLFQSIREEKGLCYNIYSHNSSFVNGGTFEIHGSTSMDNYYKTINSIYKEIECLIKNKLSESDLAEAKDMYKGSMAFNKLNPEYIMTKNARYEYIYNKHINFTEMYKKVDNTTLKNVNEIIDIIFASKKFFLTAVGPKGTDDISQKLTEKLKLN